MLAKSAFGTRKQLTTSYTKHTHCAHSTCTLSLGRPSLTPLAAQGLPAPSRTTSPRAASIHGISLRLVQVQTLLDTSKVFAAPSAQMDFAEDHALRMPRWREEEGRWWYPGL